ncbi:Hypothetical predicted protein [Cloeon dipterum]|uniref:Uncharacterized protein n=1 Tax=Cloeon dipterum TaxID=197152 RepID=A0A8S1EEB6_9INSE|nr:Hypothetical predicted protein [Cloeon dipterum]
MEGATLVEKTKWRLNRSKTLKDWATISVLSNLDTYTQEEGANYLKIKLSPELRDNVLQELLGNGNSKKCKNMDDFNSFKRSVFALMNTRTYKLDLDVVMSLYPKKLNSMHQFKEVLMKISNAAPNVRHLKMNLRNLKDCFSSDYIRNECIRYLKCLEKLKILEIVGRSFSKEDLALMCRELPNLRVLSVKNIAFDGSKMSDEKIRISFGHLTLLEVGFWSIGETNQIWKVLPNLDIVQNVARNGLTLEDFIEDEKIAKRGRKHLDFQDILWNSDVCPLFSSISHLEFSCDEKTWKRFKKTLSVSISLESLNLFVMSPQVAVDDILLKFGAHLRWLSISGNGFPSVQLNRLSELCPKLEALHLSAVDVTGSSSHPVNFVHLEELVCELRVRWTGDGLTTLLISAPNLQKVIFDTCDHKLQDLQQVKALMMEKKIFLSLTSLQWGIRVYTSEQDYKEIADIMKLAAEHLPELGKLKFSYENSIFSYKSFVKSSPLSYFRKFFNNPGLYEAIINDTNLIEILKYFE